MQGEVSSKDQTEREYTKALDNGRPGPETANG